MSVGFLVALGIASCSKEESDTAILERMAADADYAMVVNIKALVSSAGGNLDKNSIEMPEYFFDATGVDSARFVEAAGNMAACGIDIEKIGIWGYENKSTYWVARITDRRSALKYCAEKFTSKGSADDYDFYFDSSDDATFKYIALGQHYIYLYTTLDSNGHMAKYLDDSATAPLSERAYAKYIADANCAGMIIAVNGVADGLNNSFFCSRIDIEGQRLYGKAALLSVNGTPLNVKELSGLGGLSGLTSSTPKYVGADENIVLALSLKDIDWHSIIMKFYGDDDLDFMKAIQLRMLAEYLSKIDGTVVVAAGYDGTFEDFLKIYNGQSASISNIPLVIAAEIEPGKAKGILGDLESALSAYLNLSTNPLGNDGFTAKLPNGVGVIYARANENTIIVSTHPIDNTDVASIVQPLEGHSAGLSINIMRSLPILSDFDAPGDISAWLVFDSDTSEAEFSVEVTGVDAGVVEGLLRYVNVIRNIKSRLYQYNDITVF